MIKGIVIGAIVVFTSFITWCLCRAAAEADEAMGLRDEDIWRDED